MIDKIEVIENLLKIGNYEKLYRVNYNGLRLYVKTEPFQYYSGLTGAISSSTFKGDISEKRLKGWREEMINTYGKKASDDYVDFTADFGTLLHTALVTIKENGKINWNDERDKAWEYFHACYREKNLDPNSKVIKSMVFDYRKHVSSLMQFVYERVSEIYAIEIPVWDDELRIATPIDLVCSCRQTEKGDFKRTVINIKTSTSVTKHHLDQVSMEYAMWNSIYEPCDYAAILRTKDWVESKSPTFDYKYLDAIEISSRFAKISNRLRLCLLDEDATYYPNPSSKEFTGITKIGEKPEIVTVMLKDEFENTLK